MLILYGGAFNPPTIAHFQVIEYLHSVYPNAKIIIVPVNANYTKDNLLPNLVRLDMCQLMVEKCNTNTSLSTFEMDQSSFKGTVALMDYYRDLDEDVYFVMGADNILQLENWIDSERLLEEYQFIILNRDSVDINETIDNSQLLRRYKSSLHILDGFGKVDISSSQYRASRDESLLLDEVSKYIRDHHLY